ncbi:MAG TPA: YcaO-like family protein [Gammaproteobacteria bacterium]|nr:YcaO-like family protein [Gammaproteobacteria bacterium]
MAPWVIKKENILLGNKLNTIKVPHLNFSTVPPSKLEYLIQNNFIIDQFDQEKVSIENPFLHYERTKMSDISLNWIWASDSSLLASAFSLKKYLSLSDVSIQWEVVTDKHTILNSLNINQLKKPFVIRLSHQEPIENKIIKKIYADLMNKTQIIWVGETTEGAHVGPIIQTYDDLEKYHVATKTWHFSQKLIELGFKDYWPSSIYVNLISDPKKIADAILEIVKAPPETCFLVEENRATRLWTTLIENKVSESTFFDTQFWSKGLIRNFKMDHFDSMNEGYISKCRTPCKGIDYLEGNSGKGVNETTALYSLVGESIERFSAWQSNRGISKRNKPRITNKRKYYNISQFHPFGSKWTKYLASEKIALPLYEVRDEINPNKICLVPECLIPFPYEAPELQYDVTTSSTGGLAVHSDYKKAVINGTLELFERDDLYNFFLFQKAGFALDFSHISDQLSTSMHNFTFLLNHLNNNQLDYWCIVYRLKSTLPIVHFFIHDKKNHFFSRGTGSGYTLLEAVEKSLVEGLQIRQQFLNKNGAQECIIYDNWRKPDVVEQIRTYLERLYKLPFFEHPLHSLEYTPSVLLEEIKKNLNIKKKPLLVADLPCAIEGWYAIRVLIPGFTTHQYSSESAGGKKITNPIFTYGVPT